MFLLVVVIVVSVRGGGTYLNLGGTKGGGWGTAPEADFIECSLTLLYLTDQVIFNVTMSLINACNHGYTCLYTTNVVNTQLPQLYYNYNECFSLFSRYCILQCKDFGGTLSMM